MIAIVTLGYPITIVINSMVSRQKDPICHA